MGKTTRYVLRPTSAFAVIFDMDGVMIDNTPYHMKSWQQFAQRYGINLSTKDFHTRMNGRTAPDTIRLILHRRVISKQAQRFAAEKERVYRRLYRRHRKALPGLVPLLKSLRTVGIIRAVATSAPKENVRFILGGLRLRSYFTVIVDATGIKHGKPHPEIYLNTAKKLDMPPKRCIVFEDALLGIESAKRAGMKVIGISTTHSNKELRRVGADLVVKNFTSLSVAKISTLLEKP